jgi:hypothetical protein
LKGPCIITGPSLGHWRGCHGPGDAGGGYLPLLPSYPTVSATVGEHGGAGLCDAVGYSHLPKGSNDTLIESWNGASWSVVPSPNPLKSGFSILEGISCAAPSLCSAGGRWYGVNPNMPNQVTSPTETLIETIGGQVLGGPVVGISADPITGGYLLVAADGGVDAFNAPYFGAVGGIPLSQPIVGMAATPDGGGYWLAASDGGAVAFGNAKFYGSTGAIHLNKPVVGMAADSSAGGYWLVAADGGIFAFTLRFTAQDEVGSGTEARSDFVPSAQRVVAQVPFRAHATGASWPPARPDNIENRSRQPVLRVPSAPESTIVCTRSGAEQHDRTTAIAPMTAAPNGTSRRDRGPHAISAAGSARHAVNRQR